MQPAFTSAKTQKQTENK